MEKFIAAITALFTSILLFISQYTETESISTVFPNNACQMLQQNPDWYQSLKDSEDKWGTPIHTQLSFIRQESAFKHDARPVRKNKWYELGENYASSAHGYSQALVGTWDHYLKSTMSVGMLKSRESFRDSTDFIGWYNSQSNSINKIDFDNPKELYLAYHEGWNGYKKKTYLKEGKGFLKRATKNIVTWDNKYKEQLSNCSITTETDWKFQVRVVFEYIVIIFGFLLTVLSFIFEIFYDIISFALRFI